MKKVLALLVVMSVFANFSELAWGQYTGCCTNPAMSRPSSGGTAAQPAAQPAAQAVAIPTPQVEANRQADAYRQGDARKAAEAQRAEDIKKQGSINTQAQGSNPKIGTGVIQIIPTNPNIPIPVVPEISWTKVDHMCNEQLYLVINDDVGVKEEIRREGSGVVLCEELNRAGLSGQPMVLFITEDGNKEVERVEKYMFANDAEVVNTIGQFARMKIDIKKMDKQILERYGIGQAPTFIVMLSNFTIAKVTDKMASRSFDALLKEVLKKEEELKNSKK